MSGILGGLTIAKSIWDMFQAKRQEKKLNQMVDATGQYQADAGVRENLALAKSVYNGRMAGATAAEGNILSNQSATVDGVQRTATDASQALSVINGVQGNTDAALTQLATAEAQDQQQKAGQLQQSVVMNANENGKVWADKLRKLNMKLGIKEVAEANVNNAVGGLTEGLGMVGTAIKNKIQGQTQSIGAKKLSGIASGFKFG